jgi:predicted transporter
VFTVVGVMLRDGPGGVVLFPGLLFLLSAPLIPARPKADRMRRSELERELAVYSTPAQWRLATRAMAAAYAKPVSGHRPVLSAAPGSPAARLSW